MTRLWPGAAVAARVVITALGADGSPLRRLHATVPGEHPVTIDVPPGTRRVALQGTTADPRTQVELVRHRRRRDPAGQPARQPWSIRWRVWRNRTLLLRIDRRR